MSRSVVVSALRAACDAVGLNGEKASSSESEKSLLGGAGLSRPDMSLEALEGRQLMAISLAGGVLKIGGLDGIKNSISVTKSGSNYVAKLNSTSQTFSSSQISSIELYGGDNNDTIFVDQAITTKAGIDARAGNDTVNGGAGNDTVYGDNGNDLINGNGGNDSLYGETGNDTVDGGAGTDKVDGGTGTNLLLRGESGAPTTPTTPPTGSSAYTVTAIELWDVTANKKIQTISSGQTLDLANLPSKLSIVAVTSSSAASVKFGFDSNSNYRVENGKPFAINGDTSGKLGALVLTNGSHTVTVTPYSKTGATGTVGTSKSITFTVKNAGGSTVPTTPNPPTPPSTGGITPRDTSASAPRAVITAVSSTTINAGQSFSANAMSSALNDGTPLTARYVWDFGDSGSRYNVLQGFNASHFYSRAGTYTVTLTLTNEAGKTNVTTTRVTVKADTRRKIYVSASGSDSNDGLSESRPIKTWDKALTKIGDNTEILFRGGDTFSTDGSMVIYKNNVVVGSYGSGKATLKYAGPRNYGGIIYLGGQGGGEVTVENLIFDSIYTANDGKAGLPQAIGISGTGDTVINCEFRNLGYGIQTNGLPNGLLVQDNTAPLATGLRGYFVWAGGNDLVFLVNYVTNVDGHVIRMAEVNRVLVAYNDFNNPNEDTGYRGTLTIHKGTYAYVANNKLTDGWFSVGPLGDADGLTDKSARWKWSVFEGNVVTRSKFIVLHGAERTMFRNNIIKADNGPGIEIQGYNTDYSRGAIDVTVANNTVINNGTSGNFIRVGGDVNGIQLLNNLYVAPNLQTGADGSAPVYVNDSNLNSFTKINGNVWPSPNIGAYAEGGINYVWGSWSNKEGYKTPAEWEAYGVVIKDLYQDTSFNSSSFAPSTSSLAANGATVIDGVFTDMNGKIRSATGQWTAGAVEV